MTVPMLAPPECDNAADAAMFLRAGGIIDWQPGDMTRYLVTLAVTRDSAWLVVLTPRPGVALELTTYPATVDYWVAAGLRGGTWAGLRPLLAALHAAPGDPVYDPDDINDETKARTL